MASWRGRWNNRKNTYTYYQMTMEQYIRSCREIGTSSKQSQSESEYRRAKMEYRRPPKPLKPPSEQPAVPKVGDQRTRVPSPNAEDQRASTKPAARVAASNISERRAPIKSSPTHVSPSKNDLTPPMKSKVSGTVPAKRNPVIPKTVTHDSEDTTVEDISPINKNDSEEVSDPTLPSNLGRSRDKEATMLAILTGYYHEIGGWKNVEPMAIPRVTRSPNVMKMVSIPMAQRIEYELLEAMIAEDDTVIAKALDKCAQWTKASGLFALCTLADILIAIRQLCVGDETLRRCHPSMGCGFKVPIYLC